jgi:hypothetical protein
MNVRSYKNQLFLIVVIAVLLRLGAAFYMGNQIVELPGTADQLSYHTLATRVTEGFGFSFEREWWPITKPGAPTAHWSFLYTFFLAVIYKIFGPNPLIARVMQAIIVGILHPYLAFLIGSKVFTRTIGLIFAGLTAVYIYFIYYSATLMTEPFYITAILASLFLSALLVDIQIENIKDQQVSRTYAISASLGLVLGIVVLLRQLFFLIIPFLFLWIWFAVYKRGGRSIVIPLSLTTLIVVIMILPFTIYNFIRFDRFVLLNTNAGYALYWANHPIYGDKFIPILPEEMGTYQKLIPQEIRNLDEAALDQELLRRGIQFIMDDPIRYVKLSISRIPAYFVFWPSHDSGTISNISRVFSFGIFLPFMVYGLYLSIAEYRLYKLGLSSPIFLLLLFILIYSTIHILTWALIRYRLPVDAVLLLFAGVAFHKIALWIFSKSNSSSQIA